MLIDQVRFPEELRHPVVMEMHREAQTFPKILPVPVHNPLCCQGTRPEGAGFRPVLFVAASLDLSHQEKKSYPGKQLLELQKQKDHLAHTCFEAKNLFEPEASEKAETCPPAVFLSHL